MPMDLGDAKITISAKDDASAKLAHIGRNADAMSKKFRTIGKVMVGVGIAIAGALTAAVVSYVKAGDEVHKMAIRTGFATEALSELNYVAKIAGTELTSIEKATKRMNKSIADAARGLETYARSFRELGLDIEKLKAMSPEDQFWAIANALADVEDHYLKSALAQEIFGRAGVELLPILATGSEALDAQRQKAHDLGVVFDEEAAEKAAKLNDAMTTLTTSLQGVGVALAEDLVPAITEFLEHKVIPVITAIKDWIKENEGLAIALGVVAGLLVVGGALLLGLSALAKAIIAVNTALAIMHGLSGPGAWLQLAAGAAIAATTIAWINETMKGAGVGTTEGIPAAQYCTEHPEDPFCAGWSPEMAQPTPTSPEPPVETEADVLERVRRRVKEISAGGGTPELPEYQYGGIVPGALGQPVPIMAHGGEEFAGVGNRRISPQRETHIHIGNFLGDDLSLRQFTRVLQGLMREEERRTSFSGVNDGYFHGGSNI